MSLERRRSNEILLAIIEALVAQRTWTQARLARHLEVEVRTLRSYMRGLERLGVERQVDGRDVYFSVPMDWLAGAGVNLGRQDVLKVVRQVLLAPTSEERNDVLSKLTASMPHILSLLDLEAVSVPEPRPSPRAWG